MSLARHSHRHSRRAQESLHGRSLGWADMCRPILAEPQNIFGKYKSLPWLRSVGNQFQMWGLAQEQCHQCPCSHFLGEELCLLRYSLTTDGGLDWPMLRDPIPGTVVVWSCNQVARVPCSVVKKQQKAKETPSRPSSPPQSSQCPGVAEMYRGGHGSRGATLRFGVTVLGELPQR